MFPACLVFGVLGIIQIQCIYFTNQQRYKTSIETFLIGKINTLDLNDAQNSKDAARQKHISELYYYWYYFYQIRSLTLWDFRTNTELEADFDEIIRQ